MYAPLARWLEETHGRDALLCAAGEAGLDPADLDNRQRFVSHEQAERWLQAVYWYCGDGRVFQEAAGYGLAGNLRRFGGVLTLLARTSRRLLITACLHSGQVSPRTRFEVVASAPRRLTVRYVSPFPESRLMCLARMGRGAALPSLWGMPPAHVGERACLARGDDACVYELRFLAGRRWLPGLLGLLAGGAAGAGLRAFGLLEPAGLVSVPLLVGALAQLWETSRTHRHNLVVAGEIGEALQRMSREEIEARRELQRLEEIRRQWANDLDLDRTVEAARLRGFSHDLRNPLAVLRLQAELLRRELARHGGPIHLVDEHLHTLDEVDELVAGMLATLGHGKSQRARQPVRVDALAARTERRLRALGRGRPLTVSLSRRPSAPEEVEVDALALDRVLDNLMMNALKYTDQGSVEVELSGADAGRTLVVSVKDTGQGIAAEDLRSIFEPAGSDPARRRPGSYGLGLSVVVQLLHEMGARLEVESLLGQGSAFRCYIPSRLRHLTPPPRPLAGPQDLGRSLVEQVVTVRAAAPPVPPVPPAS